MSSRRWRHNLRGNGRHKSQRWHVNHAAVWLCFPCGLCHRWMRASFWKKPATDLSDNIFFCLIQNIAIDFDRLDWITVKKVARLTGLEPATSGVTGRHSNQLSYNRATSWIETAVARLTGLEPATSGVTGRHSNQLSYNRLLSARSIRRRRCNRRHRMPRQAWFYPKLWIGFQHH